MARATKAAVLDEELDETTEEQSPKQIINDGISRFLAGAGLDVQHARYKVMRAIAYTAFTNAIADGTFDALVDQAISEAGNLPSGWGLERSAKEEAPAKAAPARKTATKAAPAKAPAARKAPARKPAATKAATPRKRPTR